MTRRRTEKPVERLRSSWTSTADLEETIAAMFQHPEAAVEAGGEIAPPAKVSGDGATEDAADLQVRPREKGSQLVKLSGDTGDKMTGGAPVNLAGDGPDKLSLSARSGLEGQAAGGSDGVVAFSHDDARDKLTGPLYVTLDGLVVDSRCIRPYDQIQSAHTPSEQVVYATMWRFLAAYADESPSREGILPMVAIAHKASLSLRNLRRVLRSLEAKLAIEVIGFEDKTRSIPRRYRIWGPRAVMERRRRVGYAYIYRNRNLITLAKSHDIAVRQS